MRLLLVFTFGVLAGVTPAFDGKYFDADRGADHHADRDRRHGGDHDSVTGSPSSATRNPRPEGRSRVPAAHLAARVAELEAQVEVLTAALAEAQEILQFVRVETGEINRLAGPHWIIEGANVHVRSGSERTDDGCSGFHLPDVPTCPTLTGLGNLVVGYNEEPVPLVEGSRVVVFRWGSTT